MNIAVASGKGGTGKTCVAIALALSAPFPARLLDCDVEEPNCHLFLSPEIRHSETLAIPLPVVSESRCTACGKCAEVCQFNAIAVFGDSALVFPELCHGCGGCALACPYGAIAEGRRSIGQLGRGSAGALGFVHGKLNVGEPMAPPLIRAVMHLALPDRVNIADCPPGTSCPMVSAVKENDYALLVTEPTPFGLHDLALAVETVRILGLPMGVVVNRTGIGDDRVQRYCDKEGIPVLMEIPHDRRIAEAYSRGEPILGAVPGMDSRFGALWKTLESYAVSRPPSALK